MTGQPPLQTEGQRKPPERSSVSAEISRMSGRQLGEVLERRAPGRENEKVFWELPVFLDTERELGWLEHSEKGETVDGAEREAGRCQIIWVLVGHGRELCVIPGLSGSH